MCRSMHAIYACNTYMHAQLCIFLLYLLLLFLIEGAAQTLPPGVTSITCSAAMAMLDVVRPRLDETLLRATMLPSGWAKIPVQSDVEFFARVEFSAAAGANKVEATHPR